MTDRVIALSDLAAAFHIMSFGLVLIALVLTAWRAARGPAHSDLFLAFFQLWLCAISLIGLTAAAFDAASLLEIVFGAAFLTAFLASLAGYCARRAAVRALPRETATRTAP